MEGFIAQLSYAGAMGAAGKTFTVPAGQNYEVLGIFATLVATADVGNRQMQVDFGDGTNVIYAVPVGEVTVASATRYYAFSVGSPDLTNERATSYYMTPIPPFILPAAYTIKVYDSASIEDTDALTVRIMVRVYPKLPT